MDCLSKWTARETELKLISSLIYALKIWFVFMTPINLKGDAKISRKFKQGSRSNKIIFVSASNKVTYFSSFE